MPNTDATNPANIVQTLNYRFVTDDDITYWNTGIRGAVTIDALDIDWSLATSFFKSVSSDSAFTFSNTVLSTAKAIVVTISNSSASPIFVTFPSVTVIGGQSVNGIVADSGYSTFFFYQHGSYIFCQQQNPNPYELNATGGTLYPTYCSSWFDSINANKTYTLSNPSNGRVFYMLVRNTNNASSIALTFNTTAGFTTTFQNGSGSGINASQTQFYIFRVINGTIWIQSMRMA